MDLNLHALTRHFVRLLHLGPISPISISVIAYKIKKSTTNRNGHWTDWTKRPRACAPRAYWSGCFEVVQGTRSARDQLKAFKLAHNIHTVGDARPHQLSSPLLRPLDLAYMKRPKFAIQVKAFGVCNPELDS